MSLYLPNNIFCFFACLVGIPMGIPRGIPRGVPMGIPMGIPIGIPMGILRDPVAARRSKDNSTLPHWRCKELCSG